jgi:hypothetical protein
MPSLPSVSEPSTLTPSFEQPNMPDPGLSLSNTNTSQHQLNVGQSDVRSSPPDLPNDSASMSDEKDYAHKVLEGEESAIRWLASQPLVCAAIHTAEHEDVGLLDPYERQRAHMQAHLLRADPTDVDVNLRMCLPMLCDDISRKDAIATADEKDAKINAMEEDAQKALPVIHPFIDGRLKDVAPREAK